MWLARWDWSHAKAQRTRSFFRLARWDWAHAEFTEYTEFAVPAHPGYIGTVGTRFGRRADTGIGPYIIRMAAVLCSLYSCRMAVVLCTLLSVL